MQPDLKVVQAMDLQSMEMLVLSQCRMADGVPSSGEGVFGMRRAAAIAGVKTVVAPLWKNQRRRGAETNGPFLS